MNKPEWLVPMSRLRFKNGRLQSQWKGDNGFYYWVDVKHVSSETPDVVPVVLSAKWETELEEIQNAKDELHQALDDLSDNNDDWKKE